jgi:DNA-binding response OmpR family regulator
MGVEGLNMPVRVLIVDDETILRNKLRHHLECIGCEVVAEAENTLQALALFRNVSPSLVILDIGVAQTGGIGVLALLRIMRSRDPSVPVLMMGTSGLPEIRKSLLREGAGDYLIKPCNLLDFDYIRRRLQELFPQLIGARADSRPANPEQRPMAGR